MQFKITVQMGRLVDYFVSFEFPSDKKPIYAAYVNLL